MADKEKLDDIEQVKERLRKAGITGWEKPFVSTADPNGKTTPCPLYPGLPSETGKTTAIFSPGRGKPVEPKKEE